MRKRQAGKEIFPKDRHGKTMTPRGQRQRQREGSVSEMAWMRRDVRRGLRVLDSGSVTRLLC